MSKDITIREIETNNLKRIDVCLKKKALNLIIGPSGSGKSSLAYDTIAQIGLNELGSMYYDTIDEPQYSVGSYSNMLVTVPIKQINTNNNIRSTIGTYFSLNPCIAKIYSSLLNVPFDFFILNKSENVCPSCMGIGYTKKLDPIKIVDYSKALDEVPIRCWNRNKDFYKAILKLYCTDLGISPHKTFRQLSESEKEAILYGKSEAKYTIKYKSANRYSTRTTYYYGILTETPMLRRFIPNKTFYSEQPCSVCNGQKFDAKHGAFKLCGLSVGEVMLLPFTELLSWVEQIKKQYASREVEFSLSQIEQFAKEAVELNLGHLFLNRTIPSLSGGELQRLRLIKVFCSQLSDLLIILDEPLAGLSGSEKKIVYEKIKHLTKKHTLLVVDHHFFFINDASNIIALGEGSGSNGGSIIDPQIYLSRQNMLYDFTSLSVDKLIHISITSDIYGFKGIDITLAQDRMNIITGPSGIGKSTLLREYLERYFESYIYINQNPLVGNSRSTVATDLGILNSISTLYAKKFNLSKSLFSNMSGAEGSCKYCSGTGFITLGSESQSQVTLRCKECRGTGFDKRTNRYKIRTKSIQDILEMTIDEAFSFFEDDNNLLTNSLGNAQKLLLGHLKLSEKTSDLSGGENVRIKLLKHMKSDSDIIGIDEPFKGLNNEEIYKIVLMLEDLSLKGKTIIVVDHEENSFKYFSRRIELQNKQGILTEFEYK